MRDVKFLFFFFSSRRRHTRWNCDWSSDVCSSDLKQRKLLALANRNAFYYLLDRATGEFVSASPYAHYTWTKGLDDSGRPEVDAALEPSEKGTLVSPSLYGATNWYSPSYSPATKLVYVSVREQSSYFYKTEAEYRKGATFLGGGE